VIRVTTSGMSTTGPYADFVGNIGNNIVQHLKYGYPTYID
jgi:hypothetical protein